MARFIVVYSIGPVQSMIASARKLEDLWSGSFLLSKIVEQSMTIAEDVIGVDQINWIQPFKDNSNNHSTSSDDRAENPNRFLFTAEANDAEALKQSLSLIDEQIHDSFTQLGVQAGKAMFGSKYTDIIAEQITEQTQQFLEIFWSFTPFENEHEFEQVRQENEQKLASVKNMREGDTRIQEGLVCTVCKQDNALSYSHPSIDDSYSDLQQDLNRLWGFIEPIGDDSNPKIQKGERLCAVCTIKRMLRKLENFERFPSVSDFTFSKTTSDEDAVERYYAMVMFDGDDMGKWVSHEHPASTGEISLDSLKDITQRLSSFSTQGVAKSLEGHGKKIRVVYSGGDDVLALGEINSILAFVSNLRESFATDEYGLHPLATASSGIVIAPEKRPLQQVVHYARQAESKSKSFENADLKLKKDAFTIHFVRNSGNQRLITLPFKISNDQVPYTATGESQNTLDWISQLVYQMKELDVGRSYIYQFQNSFQSIALNHHKNHNNLVFQDSEEGLNIIHSELLRTLTHTVHIPNSQDKILQIANELTNIYAIYQDDFTSYIHLLELIFYLGTLIPKEEV